MTENLIEKGTKFDVLDKGYVIFHDALGDDLTPVNAARVSHDNKSDELSEGDRRLLAFLAREGHSSPFRHAIIQLEVYSPLMVARQWWKYIVGSTFMEAPVGDTMNAWNESSRRYVKEVPTFYTPSSTEWRSKPKGSVKQGSGECLPAKQGVELTESLIEYYDEGVRLYEKALEDGVAAEQARLFLPANGMYVRYYWTASLQSMAHFVQQRMADDAQKEIREYAKVILEIIKGRFPVSTSELLKEVE